MAGKQFYNLKKKFLFKKKKKIFKFKKYNKILNKNLL